MRRGNHILRSIFQKKIVFGIDKHEIVWYYIIAINENGFNLMI